MDACAVTVSGPRSHAVSKWLPVPLRHLSTGDTLRTFANGRVAQHPVDSLGVGVGVPRLLVTGRRWPLAIRRPPVLEHPES